MMFTEVFKLSKIYDDQSHPHHPVHTGAILGLVGRAGSGKTTFAEALPAAGQAINMMGGNWCVLSFGDIIFYEVCRAYHLDGFERTARCKEANQPVLKIENCHEKNFVRWLANEGERLSQPRSVRWVMQQWGAYKRRTSNDYWINQINESIRVERSKHAHKEWLNIAIADVRTQAEADYVRHLMGGKILRIQRDHAHLRQLADDTASDTTEAQYESIDSDGIIDNTGNLSTLHAQVMDVAWSAYQRNTRSIEGGAR